MGSLEQVVKDVTSPLQSSGDIAAERGPHWPSRMGFVHVTQAALDAAILAARSEHPSVQEICHGLVAELAELGARIDKSS